MILLDETLYWLLVIYLFVTVHFWIIERDRRQPKYLHPVSWGFSFVFAFFFSYVLYDTWYFRIVNMVYLGFLFWIFFPLLLNVFRKKDLLYLGDPKNERGSLLDRLERWAKNPGMTLGIKIAIVIAATFILLNLPDPWLNKH